ncbi:immunoglobulin lambda-1 light chain-like [Carassius auratus]|uniref:immunoglobulin lambda-1 light chain-like n=1 Tax=Carassius auratus TaxID=7957 RepID=UPI000E40D9D0|nr:immunoglobulin lambda-1 light chain-like [Carassius auratus]
MKILNAVSITGLLLSLTGLMAYNLSQEKSKSVKLGDKVSILCTAEDDDYFISWYQQKTGAAPQFLLRNDIRASDLPARFTYTDSGNQDYLTIDGVRAEDEAVYYCACIDSTGGTVLHVVPVVISARPSSPPSLLLLAPAAPLLSEGDVSVLCVAQGFYPDGVTVSWSEDSSGVTGDEVQTAPYQRQADGTFSQTSVLKLSKQRWSSGRTYTCSLSHPALSTPLSQSTSLNQCV